MKLKKQRKKKKGKLIICIIVCILLISFLIIYFSFFQKQSNFKVKSRIDNVKAEKKKDEDFYRTVGWLRIQGTKIDMPVITITGKSEAPITREDYAWTINRDGKYHNSMRIYGHNIFNLSAKPKIYSSSFKRFEELLAFVYYDFAKENQYVQLTMNDEDYVYKVFAVGIIDYYEISTLPTGEHSKKEMKEEINLFKKNTIYDYNVKVTEKDKILSLVTCTRMYGRDADVGIVVSAKLIDNRKTKRLNRVIKTKKYKKVEKTLKGDDSDEEVSA